MLNSVEKSAFYLYKILLYITWKVPELKELPSLMPGPCSEEKVHLLLGHLSDTSTATFLSQSLLELALRNIICKKRGNFSLNDILTKEGKEKSRGLIWGGSNNSSLSDTNITICWWTLFLFFITFTSKLRKTALKLRLRSASMLFLCPEIP